MNARKNTFSPIIRFAGVVALVVYAFAQISCFSHCNLGGSGSSACHGDRVEAKPHCQGGKCGGASGTSSSTDIPLPVSVCVTLKNPFSSTDDTSILPPNAISHFTALTVASFELALPKSDSAVSRQGELIDWFATPEVSLGPAFRSQAPPVLI